MGGKGVGRPDFHLALDTFLTTARLFQSVSINVLEIEPIALITRRQDLTIAAVPGK